MSINCKTVNFIAAAAATDAKSRHSSPTPCDPIDSSPPGSSVPGILQARILECVAISFSSAWKWKVKVKSLSHVRFLATPWSVAHQAPSSMAFSRQEYWKGVPLPSPIKEMRTVLLLKIILKAHICNICYSKTKLMIKMTVSVNTKMWTLGHGW